MKKTSMGILIAFVLSSVGISSVAMAETERNKELPTWHLDLQLKPY